MPDQFPDFPDRIARLPEIASNVSWSWNREARALFRRIDPHLWTRCRHDPFQIFQLAGNERLEQCADDPEFLRRYDGVVARFDAMHATEDTWCARTFPEMISRPIAYFCAEFALHHSVPIYSGGLGVLAGDHCKAASDLGVPLVGVGMLYRGGHFDQRIRADGWQEETDVTFDLRATPLEPVELNRSLHVVSVPMDGREVGLRAWRVRAGRVSLYLLDTDLETNHPDDRGLLRHLYPSGHDRRLRQEWLFGVGGVRLLRALDVHPVVWHANEGHAAFRMIERVRELVEEGTPWTDAVSAVRGSSIFTTHTPVAAGHDAFQAGDVAQCAGSTLGEGDEIAPYLEMGVHPSEGPGRFHMTAAAIRLSSRVNGVARTHGAISRNIWKVMWPGVPEEKVPITYVTNGVHADTWMAAPIGSLIDAAIGGDSTTRATHPILWEEVLSIDDVQLWRTHQLLKAKVLRLAREESRALVTRRTHEATQLVGSGVLLDPEALTIGFARRFATYKRANLLFFDVERLLRILTNPARPVQVVFAGKAHPADHAGKMLLQEVYHATHDPRFEGRIAFIEDYDPHIAHYLVQGVDAWLNLPRVPLEACGTSGMKAALNGVPHISTLDGWWAEGFDGTNGWTVATSPREDESREADEAASNALYDVLEEEVVPAFYERDDSDLPRKWLATMKAAIRVAGSRFTAQRMLMEYVADYYVPAATAAGRFSGTRPI